MLRLCQSVVPSILRCQGLLLPSHCNHHLVCLMCHTIIVVSRGRAPHIARPLSHRQPKPNRLLGRAARRQCRSTFAPTPLLPNRLVQASDRGSWSSSVGESAEPVSDSENTNCEAAAAAAAVQSGPHCANTAGTAGVLLVHATTSDGCQTRAPHHPRSPSSRMRATLIQSLGALPAGLRETPSAARPSTGTRASLVAHTRHSWARSSAAAGWAPAEVSTETAPLLP